MTTPRFLLLALAATAVSTLVPAPVLAATWVETLSNNPDSDPGGRHVQQTLVITPDELKVQTLAYQTDFPGLGRAIRIARRSVPIGALLEDGDWTFSDAHYVQPNPPYVNNYVRVDLAVDRVTAAPYVIYVDSTDETLELSRYVGDGQGTCGEGYDWVCEDVLTACGMEEQEIASAYAMPFRIELESELDSPADAAHVMFYVSGSAGNELAHARRDLLDDSWACQVLPGAGPINGIGMQSVSVFHEFDARLKPQIAYPIAGGRTGRLEMIRSLLDYAGTPVPPLSWTPASTISLAGPPDYGTPAMAVRDEGLGSQGEAFLTGIGVPALVEVRRDSYSLPQWPVCHGSGSWTMDYRVAQDFAGSSRSAPETIVAGRPCGPAMTFGWDENPYVIYRDEAQDTLMLTTRRHDVAHPWSTPQTIGDSPTWSDIAFDPDRGTISIVYLEHGAEHFTVTDGFMHETL